MRRALTPCLLAVSLSASVGCGQPDRAGSGACAGDTPSAWDCSSELELTEHASDCSEIESGEEPLAFEVVDAESPVLSAAGIRFASDETVCAYKRSGSGASDEMLEIVLQPCEMHPSAAEKGTCYYDFVVDLGTVHAAASSVTVHRRYAFLLDGSGMEPELVPLDTLDLP